MNIVRLTYASSDPARRRLFVACLISVLFHLLLFYLLKSEAAFRIDLTQNLTKTPEEVTILFPENRPKQIVENINENQEVPQASDLLSEMNSRAQDQSLLEERRNQPASTGNTPIANLSEPPSLAENSYAKKSIGAPAEKFSRQALLGDRGFRMADEPQLDGFESGDQETHPSSNGGTNNVLNQEEFSADAVGKLTLSTYAWEWASYINHFKRKLYQVWRTPPAYFDMGMIHGQTVIRLTIDRNGRMVDSQVLDHQGHSSLQVSSENAVNGVFPLKPLPVDFPDQTLTLTLTLVYPDLRKRRY